MTGKEAKERLSKQYKRQNEYIKEKYDRVSVVLPDKTKDRIKELTGKSCNAYISALVLADLDLLENGGSVEKPKPQNKPKLSIYEQNEILLRKQKEVAELRAKEAQEEEPKETEEERTERLKYEQIIIDELKAKDRIIEQDKEELIEQSKIKANIEEEPPF